MNYLLKNCLFNIFQIAWGYLLNKLFNMEFDDTTSVQVYFMDYIKDFFAQLQTKSSR